MTFTNSSQIFESYLPVYDAIPEEWDEAKDLLTERLKEIANAVNAREISWFLDEELLSGKQFIPSSVIVPGNNPGVFRSIFRKVVDTGALVAGAKSVPHGITFDVNFTLIDLWVSATNSVTFNATTMSDPSNVTMNATNINITSPGTFDRSFAVIEYIQEI